MAVIDEIKAKLDVVAQRLGGPSVEETNLSTLSQEFRLYQELVNNYKMDDATAKATIEAWKQGTRTW